MENLSIVKCKTKYLVKKLRETVTVSNLNPLVKLRPKMAYSVDYAITITIMPSLYRKTYEEQYNETANSIKNLFHDCKLTLVAELTQAYNIHYHGIIAYPLCDGGGSKDVRKIIFDRLRKYSKVGNTKIDQITDYNGWVKYIQKDPSSKKYRPIENIDPVVVDDYKCIEIDLKKAGEKEN